jgi:hypothetical protein
MTEIYSVKNCIGCVAGNLGHMKKCVGTADSWAMSVYTPIRENTGCLLKGFIRPKPFRQLIKIPNYPLF